MQYRYVKISDKQLVENNTYTTYMFWLSPNTLGKQISNHIYLYLYRSVHCFYVNRR